MAGGEAGGDKMCQPPVRTVPFPYRYLSNLRCGSPQTASGQCHPLLWATSSSLHTGRRGKQPGIKGNAARYKGKLACLPRSCGGEVLSSECRAQHLLPLPPKPVFKGHGLAGLHLAVQKVLQGHNLQSVQTFKFLQAYSQFTQSVKCMIADAPLLHPGPPF